jgi:hypothetical protein
MMGSLAGDAAGGGHIHHSDKSGQSGIDLPQRPPFWKRRVFDKQINSPKMPRTGKKRLRFVRNLTVEG